MKALADINGVPAERIISGAKGAALTVLTRGATGWWANLVAKGLYNILKLCQVADATEDRMSEAWLRATVVAHAVGAAEAKA